MRIGVIALLFIVGALLGAEGISFNNGFVYLVSSPTSITTTTYTQTLSISSTNLLVAYSISSMSFENPAASIQFIVQKNYASSSSVTFSVTMPEAFKFSLLALTYIAMRGEEAELSYSTLNHNFHVTQYEHDYSSTSLESLPGTIRSSTETLSAESGHYHYHRPRIFYFLTGIKVQASGPLKKIEVKVESSYLSSSSHQRTYIYEVQVGDRTKITILNLMILEIDEWAFLFDKGYVISSSDFKQELAVQTGDMPYADAANNKFLIGLSTAFSTIDQISGDDTYSFNWALDPVNDIALFSIFPLNKFTTIQIIPYSCAAGQLLDITNLACPTTRYGCSSWMEALEITIPDSQSATKVIIHESNRFFLIVTGYLIQFFNYDADKAKFIKYYTISHYSTTETFNDVAISKDFSKLVVAGRNLLRTYLWNGTDYVSSYFNSFSEYEIVAGGPYTISSCSISDDGRVVTANGDFLISRDHTFILMFNENRGTYELQYNLPFLASMQKFLSDTDEFTIIGTSSYAIFTIKGNQVKLNFNSSFGSPPESYSFSGDGKCLAVSDESISYSSTQNIKIYNYKSDSFTYTLIQEFQPRFILFNYKMALNRDGTTLSIGMNDGFKSMTLVYRRATTTDMFAESEVLGVYDTKVGDHYLTGVSPDGEMLVSSGKNIEVYYCADMLEAQTIPAQTVMYSSGTTTDLTDNQAENTADNQVTETAEASEQNSTNQNRTIQTLILVLVIIATLLLIVNLIFNVVKAKPQQTNPSERTYDTYGTENPQQSNISKNLHQRENKKQLNADQSIEKYQFNSINPLNDSSPVLRKRKRKREKNPIDNDNEINMESEINIQQID